MKKKRSHVFDPFRRKKIALTPEELVRQKFAEYLINELGYPKSHISTEKSINTFSTDLKKRYDILVYGKNFQPDILIECKSFKEELKQSALEQIISYNYLIKARIIVITNGIKTLAYETSKNKLIKRLNYLPKYS